MKASKFTEAQIVFVLKQAAKCTECGQCKMVPALKCRNIRTAVPQVDCVAVQSTLEWVALTH